MHEGRAISFDRPDAIVGSIAGRLIEIRCGAPREALGLLRSRRRWSSAHLFGRRIHVIARGSGDEDAAIRAAMSEWGLADANVATVKPSLEDAFIELVEQAGGSDGA